MKFFRNAALLVALSSFAAPAFAQMTVSLAPEVGVLYYFNFAINTSTLSNIANNGTGIGGRAGLAIDFAFSDRISLQPGVYFSYDHYSNDLGVGFGSLLGDQKNVAQYDALIPINLQFKFKGFFVGLGPYIGYTFGGKIQETVQISNGGSTRDSVSTYDIKVGTDKAKDYIKPLSLGIGLNLGYKLKSGLFIRAQYLYGLSNTAPDANDKMHGYSAALSLGYFLGGGGGGNGRGPVYRFQRGYRHPYRGVR